MSAHLDHLTSLQNGHVCICVCWEGGGGRWVTSIFIQQIPKYVSNTEAASRYQGQGDDKLGWFMACHGWIILISIIFSNKEWYFVNYVFKTVIYDILKAPEDHRTKNSSRLSGWFPKCKSSQRCGTNAYQVCVARPRRMGHLHHCWKCQQFQLSSSVFMTRLGEERAPHIQMTNIHNTSQYGSGVRENKQGLYAKLDWAACVGLLWYQGLLQIR